MTFSPIGAISRRRGLSLLAGAACSGLAGFRAAALPAYPSGVSFSAWRNGSEIGTHTVDNGTAEFSEMRLKEGRLLVTGSKSGEYLAPPGSIAATHWNAAELTQPMINPQNGELMHFERRDLGEEQLSSGIVARHVALTGYASLDLWYDSADRWCALHAIASDGSVIDYRPR